MEKFFAYVLMFGLAAVGFGLLSLMVLHFIHHQFPERWQKITAYLKKRYHKHQFGPWTWIDGVPSDQTGSATGFSVSFCMSCDGAAVLPRDNLMRHANQSFRDSFLQGLKKIGRRLID